MENIHTIDSETVESLINMLNSNDSANIRLGLSILNNADFDDNKIVEYVNELYNECSGLFFAIFKNKKGDIRPRFAYIGHKDNKQSYMIDDQSTLDEGEWEPYEIHSINNMGIINDLNK
jgi:hypothetical protein